MNEFKKIGILIIGWIFIGLGILGLFLPILQGILFIMIGLAILSSRSKTIRRFLTIPRKAISPPIPEGSRLETEAQKPVQKRQRLRLEVGGLSKLSFHTAFCLLLLLSFYASFHASSLKPQT